MKKLKWKSSIGISAHAGDMMAHISGMRTHFYSVYQGIQLDKFYWFLECGQFKADVHECSSIEDGMKQAETHYREKHKK